MPRIDGHGLETKKQESHEDADIETVRSQKELQRGVQARCLGIVSREITGGAEVFGEKFHAFGQRTLAAHVLRAHATGETARDDARARRGTDSRGGITAIEDDTTGGDAIDVGRARQRVAVRPDGGGDIILGDDPEDVGPISRSKRARED